MPELDFMTMFALLGVLLFSATVHEMAHAGGALFFGDPTAKEEGRITLNPLAHIDPYMSILVPITLYLLAGFFFGGAKPVPVDTSRFREGVVPKRAMALVALAGPVSNFIQAFLFYYIAFQAASSIGYEFRTTFLWKILTVGAYINVLLGVFNLIPIPPLDGSKVIAGILPDPFTRLIYAMERYAIFLVFGIFGLMFFLSTTLPIETLLYPFDKTDALISAAAEAIVF